MDPGLARDVLTAVLGFFTGVLSGLFGVGGGVISQPGMRALGLAPLLVIGTALPVIIPGAASGTFRYVREHMILWPAVRATVPAGLVAAVLGAKLVEEVPGDGHLLQLLTACLLGLSAYRMSRIPATAPPTAGLPELAESDAPEAPEHPHAATGVLDERGRTTRFVGIGAVSGLLSGLLGIGGGVVMVPAFVQLTGMEVKRAIATSLACVGMFAVPGAITHAIDDHIAWGTAIALVVGVIPGARVGAALTIRATDRRLRLAVGAFLGLTAVVYGVGELSALLS